MKMSALLHCQHSAQFCHNLGWKSEISAQNCSTSDGCVQVLRKDIRGLKTTRVSKGRPLFIYGGKVLSSVREYELLFANTKLVLASESDSAISFLDYSIKDKRKICSKVSKCMQSRTKVGNILKTKLVRRFQCRFCFVLISFCKVFGKLSSQF